MAEGTGMKIRLKGLNRAKKKLADGSTATYYYAWKGGPRLSGEPGSPEFIAAFNEAVRVKIPQKTGQLDSIFDRFLDSSEFTRLADNTQRDYRSHIAALAAKFGDFPIAALSDQRSRGVFLEYRDEVEKTSARTADYRFSVFARVLSWASKGRGIIKRNPLESIGRVYRSERRDAIWSAHDEARFLKFAPAHLHLALLLALWTGQRQGDLLRLTWAAYDGKTITVRQNKTGARMRIPVGGPLRPALDALRGDDFDAILTNARGVKWTPDGFRTSWAKACKKADISGVTFHDLRGTAVTRLALAGCEIPEIAAITGHSLRDAGAILESHYLARDPKLGESAIRKLEKALQESQPDSQLGIRDID
jgi:integrase